MGGEMTEYNIAALRRRRLVRGWSVVALAKRIHMSPRTVWRVEAGQTARPSTIKEMADSLGLSMEDVVK
jgi:transcriptional regulator with XRE-family HTH domain